MEDIYFSLDARTTKEPIGSAMFRLPNSGIPHLMAFEREGITVILGEDDEMLNGFFTDRRDIIATGSNFNDLKKNLEALLAVVTYAERQELLDSMRGL